MSDEDAGKDDGETKEESVEQNARIAATPDDDPRGEERDSDDND